MTSVVVPTWPVLSSYNWWGGGHRRHSVSDYGRDSCREARPPEEAAGMATVARGWRCTATGSDRNARTPTPLTESTVRTAAAMGAADGQAQNQRQRGWGGSIVRTSVKDGAPGSSAGGGSRRPGWHRGGGSASRSQIGGSVDRRQSHGQVDWPLSKRVLRQYMI